MIELLAPCHDFATLKSAVINGANAVYFGVKSFNMRLGAKNFSVNDLKKIVNYCHNNSVKSYLTINSIIYETELLKVDKLVEKAKLAKVDAIIIHDLSLIPIAKKYKIPFHISTQASISNSVSANVYKSLGASRVILAREVSLKDLKKIVENSNIPIEVFVHGAMCVSISGRCFFSQELYGKSANRGECMQPCRQKWIVKNDSGELIYDGERFLNAKDLCTIEFLDKIIKTGVVSLKIEGRRKDSFYISTIVKVYREAIDNWNKKRIPEWLDMLNSVFNRGFSSGFYLRTPGKESINFKDDGNTSTFKKTNLGIVKDYYSKIGVAKILLNHKGVKLGDEIIVEGKTSFVRQKVESLEVDNKKVKKAEKNNLVALKVNDVVRKNDNVYLIKKV